MLKEVLEFVNDFGNVVILQEKECFSVKYSIKKMPGIYHCCVNNFVKYDDALKCFNRYKGALKQRESKYKFQTR